MNELRKYGWLAVALVLIGGSFTVILSNDSAASTAIGGIQLRREANISMEKERLTISETKVTVEYEFLNETDKDITTEVAFPIPPYDYGFTDAGGQRDSRDFRLWVEGKELKYDTDLRAKLNGTDYTELLKKMGIDIASFGGWDNDHEGNPVGPITKLPKTQLQQLSSLGLIVGSDGASDEMLPLWDNVKTYHWTQTFPAHKVLHVRHEYTPSIGFELIGADTLDPKKPHTDDIRDQQIENACVDPSLRNGLMDKARKYGPRDDVIDVAWVDYILTTANSWKTPIKDFTLIIAKSKDFRIGTGTQYVSLCWDGPIRSLDADHFLTHETNFVPKKELHVAFFTPPVK